MSKHDSAREFILLGLLALLWGSSYLFTKIAVQEIPPLTLIAIRVSLAAVFLLLVLRLTGNFLPRDRKIWGQLLVQAILSCIISWTILAWGLQHIDSGLASVLNSTSPIFVFLITFLFLPKEKARWLKLVGAVIGLFGVILIVGFDALNGLGQQVMGQLAALSGAMLYGGAAIYGRKFSTISPAVTACGTMIWAMVVLVPLSVIVDRPWTITPSYAAMGAATALAIPCTGIALLIYFRLVNTIGSMGVASQAYLRAGMGVMLGVVFLQEQITPVVAMGITAAITGVALINYPARKKS